MSTNVIDTLAFANKLIKAGQTQEIAQAESIAISDILKEFTKEQLVTKNDLRDFEMRLYAFIVKAAGFIVAILGGLQTLFHFTP